MRKIYLTKQGQAEKRETLKDLINIQRPRVIEELTTAREQGDLSENADYDAARNNQAKIESQIKELENILAHSIIIESEKDNSVIRLGSKVKYLNTKTNIEREILIVGPLEVNLTEKQTRISNESPLARALLTHSVGDIVNIKGINKPYSVKIMFIG